MKKSAFSYLELIICMSLVTAAIMLSMPLSTQNQNNATDIYGEFRCFAEYDNDFKDYRLYQQQRYNSSALSQKRDVSDTGCVFTRPSGVASFTVTVVGGGGGGSKPTTPSSTSIDLNQIVEFQKDGSSIAPINSTGTLQTLRNAYGNNITDYVDCNAGSCLYSKDSFKVKVSSYILKNMQRAIALLPGAGGEVGEIVTRSSNLSNSFSQDEINIHFCKNSDIPTNSNEENFCVGKGGEGGTGEDLTNYYILLGIMHDLIHDKKGTAAGPYMGYGDGYLSNYDYTQLKTIVKNKNDLAVTRLKNYLNSRTTSNFNIALGELRNIANNKNRLKSDVYNSNGYNGSYSRFKISNTANLLAHGGKGGKIKTGTEYLYGSSNSKQTINKPFYARKGENGKHDEKFQEGNEGMGGNCICSGTECINCNGHAGTKIGSGGGGGSIVYRTNQSLNSYKAVSFMLQNGTRLNTAYDVKSASNTTEKLKQAESISEINNNEFFSGEGGAGAGGAIIINW